MVMAGSSKAEILSAIKAAFENGQLPRLESGAMDYMMSKAAYLTDEGELNAPHLMFFTAGMDARLGLWRGGLTGRVGSLLVLFIEGVIANERPATDSCVPSRGGELVRRKACGQELIKVPRM
jgi:hypothetical protein